MPSFSFHPLLWFYLIPCPFALLLGGILFKVYIVGEIIKVVRRFSLPNFSRHELEKAAGVFRFPRVSSASASADDADLEPSVAGEKIVFDCFFPKFFGIKNSINCLFRIQLLYWYDTFYIMFH